MIKKWHNISLTHIKCTHNECEDEEDVGHLRERLLIRNDVVCVEDLLQVQEQLVQTTIPSETHRLIKELRTQNTIPSEIQRLIK